MAKSGKGLLRRGNSNAVIVLAIMVAGLCAQPSFAGPISSVVDRAPEAAAPSKPLEDHSAISLPVVAPPPGELTAKPLPEPDLPQRTSAPLEDQEPTPPAQPLKPGNSDDSLRQVVRSLTTVYAAVPRAPDQEAVTPRYDPDADASSLIDVSDLILENEVAGRALRELVDVTSNDGMGVTFSVLGIGEFMIETRSGAHGATITELSTGQSVPVDSGGLKSGSADADRAAEDGNDDDGPSAKVIGILLAIHRVVDFLLSPLGILLEILVGVIAALWLGVRTAASLRRRAIGVRDKF